MKVTLDLTRLLSTGEIDQAEFERLSRLSRADTGLLAFNILVGLGVVAVGGGALALVPTPVTGIVIGLVLLAAGLVVLMTQPSWLILANICILVAALMFGGGVLDLWGATRGAFFAITAIFAAAVVAARSGMLMAFAVLALAGLVGAATDYDHASYELIIEQPALTVLVFSALALVTYLLSKRLAGDDERLAIIAARTSVLLVNLGFWVGSLWGDQLTWLHGSVATTAAPDAAGLRVSETDFTIAWGLVLLAVGLWAARADRRWVVNLVAVFSAILFYTQWFERLRATPISVLVAGLLMLVIAVGLWKWNHRLGAPPSRLPAMD